MLKDFSNKNIFKILSTESRRADLPPKELSEVHRKLGELLSFELLEFLNMEEIEIKHVQGIRKSISLSKKEKFIILTLMRGGLYVADGLKNVFDGKYNLEFVFNNDISFMEKYNNLAEYNLIIVDSVINTGKSIDDLLNQLSFYNFKRLFIVTLVIQEKAVKKYKENDNIILLTARISKNFYIGKGKTDTGNRLFNIDK
jgi:uracil phosphoribosyltransferase